MRPASPNTLTSWALSSLLLAAATAGAAPTVAQWELTHNGGSQETLALRWDETGAYEAYDVQSFAQAREILVVLPGATLAPVASSRLETKTSLTVDRARLQEVVLPSGQSGLQLTLRLREWTDFTTISDEEGLRLVLDVPKSQRPLLQQPASDPADWLELTDERLKQLDLDGFGAWDAPATGAGQDEAVSPPAPAASEALAGFYVPPQVERESTRGGRVVGSSDMNEMALQTKLNEMVRRVDFQGTSLENVLRLIAEEAELNILIRPEDVAGRQVTLRLRNVTLRQMLEAILKANDLGYTLEDGGILRIVPREQVKSTEKETIMETVAVNWVNALDVANSLRPFVDEIDGMIQVSQASNLLIVRDVPENVQRILDLIGQIDQPEKQVMIEMRLVNMTETARRAMGAQTAVQSQELDPRFVAGERNLEFTDSINSTANVDSTISRDLTGTISGNFAEDQQLGIDSSEAVDSTIDQVLIPSTGGSVGLLATGAEALTFTQAATVDIFGQEFDVDFALNAQEERGEAVTLANPKVLSLNNTQARVEIVRQIPYVSAVNSQEGAFATIEFKPVGTQVEILPRITNHGWIQMRIQPEQILDTGERPGGVPVTDERRVDASVIVRDEQTVALGGLRQFESTASEAGVPYLLRVPVLSWFFKRESNAQNKTELYLFVTPHILKDPNPTPYQYALYDKIDYNWDLPDYYFDEVTPRSSPDERENPDFKMPDY